VTLRQSTGFTLIELLVVVVIAAFLLVLALPSYQRYLLDTRRALASAALLEVMIRQEQYFLDHKRYAESLTELDFPSHPFAIDRQGTAVADAADDKTYLIDLETVESAYTLWATPQLGQAEDRLCGTLSLDSSGIKRVSGDRPARECW
jgi:type IV pilus assembly protein PilE